MYELTGKILYDLGYQKYEISNYAYPGRECIHNLGYWYRREYKGFGLGAASFLFKTSKLQGKEQASRFRNTDKLEEYLSLIAGADLQSIQKEQEILTKQEQIEETMFLGLRCRNGVSSAEFSAQFGIEMKEIYKDVIKKYCALGFLKWNEDRLCLTEKALLVSNVILQDFLLE